MLSIILYLTALVLAALMALPALIHTIIGSIRWKGGISYIKDAFMAGAHAIDVYGNVAYATLLNDYFIRKDGYHFGRTGETISSAVGKNWVGGTLTWLGLGLCGLLNLLDKDHCWKYIEGRDSNMVKPKAVKPTYTIAFVIVALLWLFTAVKLLLLILQLF